MASGIAFSLLKENRRKKRSKVLTNDTFTKIRLVLKERGVTAASVTSPLEVEVAELT